MHWFSPMSSCMNSQQSWNTSDVDTHLLLLSVRPDPPQQVNVREKGRNWMVEWTHPSTATKLRLFYQLCHSRTQDPVRDMNTLVHIKRAGHRIKPDIYATEIIVFSDVFHQEYFRRLHVLDHPGSFSGPISALPGHGQVSGRPRRRVHLSGDPVRMEWSCGLEITRRCVAVPVLDIYILLLFFSFNYRVYSKIKTLGQNIISFINPVFLSSPDSYLVISLPDLLLHQCVCGHSLPHTLLHHSSLSKVSYLFLLYSCVLHYPQHEIIWTFNWE